MQTVCNCLSINVFSCLVNFLLLSLSFQPSPSFKSMFSLRLASSSACTTFTSLFCTLLYFLSLLHCTSCTPPFPVEVPPLMLYSLISSPCLANWANFAQRVLCHVRDCTSRGLYISSAYFLHRPGLMCDSPHLSFYLLVEMCSHQFVPFTIDS